jgi:protein TonB
MSVLDLNSGYGSRDAARRLKGLIFVVALHAVIGYALMSGMARKSFDYIKKPRDAVVIQEVTIPSPLTSQLPPKKVKTLKVLPEIAPPPTHWVPLTEVKQSEVNSAPAIASEVTPLAVPAVIEKSPTAPVSAATKRTTMGFACPIQIEPEMPRFALQAGVEGVVKAQALIKDGAIKEITILSGPKIFHAAVRSAMLQYKCASDADEIIAVQEFTFKLQ